MTKREVVRTVLQHKIPPYVPWEFPFTVEAFDKLSAHYGDIDVGEEIGNHFVILGGSGWILPRDRPRSFPGCFWRGVGPAHR